MARSQSNTGINMFDVKKSNRSSIIWLVYRANGISRKAIAAQLGLTPAAITLITTDLIKEGLFTESQDPQSTGKKGRKEILLHIRKDAAYAIGVYISMHVFQLVAMDLNCKILFEESIPIDDCNCDSKKVLEKISAAIASCTKDNATFSKKKLLGIGVCVHGIVDQKKGVSINSYGILEENCAITAPLAEQFQVPVILSNNICALAHGESFLNHDTNPEDTLFIKYGPGVGAARLSNNKSRSIEDFTPVEMGHLIVEPNGSPCICGNRGCLETIAGYESIKHSLAPFLTEQASPLLYKFTKEGSSNLTIEMIEEAYKNGEHYAAYAIDRAIHYFALAVQNAVCLFRPNRVVFFGELFESHKFRETLERELSVFAVKTHYSYSKYNLNYKALGPATTVISSFIENGGVMEEEKN